MKHTLHVLMVEDNENDALLVKRELEKGGYSLIATVVQTAQDMRAALAEGTWELILSDYRMPQFNGIEALRIVKESGKDIPFIIISGVIGENVAVEAMKLGAHDYIIKGKLSRLVPAVEREMREAMLRKERALSDKAVYESERRYRQLIETAYEGILTVDECGVVTLANKRISDMLGFKAGEITGKRIEKSIPEHCKDRYSSAIGLCLKGYVQRFEAEMLRKNMESVPVSMGISPLLDDTDMVIGYLAVITDITQQRQMEREREQIRAELVQADKMAAIGQLVAGIAHELNNPLAVIVGNVQYMQKETSLPELKDIFCEVEQAAQRCKKLVADLLEFSRKKDMELRDCDCNDIVEHALYLASYQNDFSDIEVIRRFEKDLPLIKASRHHLEQVFLNIISNAVHAMGTRGKLTICTVFSSEDDFIEIQFTDTGKGMTSETLKRIFEPFFTTKAKGTGLGLLVSYNIIRQHSGTLQAYSKGHGEGSRFVVKLPVDKSQERGLSHG